MGSRAGKLGWYNDPSLFVRKQNEPVRTGNDKRSLVGVPPLMLTFSTPAKDKTTCKHLLFFKGKKLSSGYYVKNIIIFFLKMYTRER